MRRWQLELLWSLRRHPVAFLAAGGAMVGLSGWAAGPAAAACTFLGVLGMTLAAVVADAAGSVGRRRRRDVGPAPYVEPVPRAHRPRRQRRLRLAR